MKTKNINSIKEEISQNIRAINKAWLKHDFNSMRKYFHKDLVTVAPNFQRMGIGIDACVKSYEDFSTSAEIISFEDKNIQVDIVGSTATATYEYDIEWVSEENQFKEKGKEILVFSNESGTWLLNWRMVIPPTQ